MKEKCGLEAAGAGAVDGLPEGQAGASPGSDQIINPITWLKDANIGQSSPLVLRENVTENTGRVMISVSIQQNATRDPNPGDMVIIHVHSGAWQQDHVASCDAVRQALAQIESQTGHVFPDYSYFKLKALETGEADVTQMPKRISPSYESIYDDYYCGFMHPCSGLRAVLYQVLGNLGYAHTTPGAYRVNGGFQANIALSHANAAEITIYGEVLDSRYKAQDSAYKYALDYVDRFLGIEIIDINYPFYLMKKHGVQGP